MAEKAGSSNLHLSFYIIIQTNFIKTYSYEDIVDRYEDKLGSYIVKLTGKSCRTTKAKKYRNFYIRYRMLNASATAVNIADVAREMYEKKCVFF